MNDWTERSQSVILCEGFHDRAFWQGWLKHLKCIDPGIKPGLTVRTAFKDPWEENVVKGHFGYRSQSGRFIRVIPCGGKENIRPEARKMLKNRSLKPLARLVLNLDPDVVATAAAVQSGVSPTDVLAFVREFDGAARIGVEGEIEIDGGATRISLIRWECDDAQAPGLPDQQTLERLVCASLCAAYPDRGPCVDAWLKSRPGPPHYCVKEHVWSFMAGWHAEEGCDTFYARLWDDPQVVAELQTRLSQFGVWRIAQALAG